MAKNDGGPVFGEELSAGDMAIRHKGLTVRDFFAGVTMISLVRNSAYADLKNDPEDVAKIAGGIADAMIAEREKE